MSSATPRPHAGEMGCPSRISMKYPRAASIPPLRSTRVKRMRLLSEAGRVQGSCGVRSDEISTSTTDGQKVGRCAE